MAIIGDNSEYGFAANATNYIVGFVFTCPGSGEQEVSKLSVFLSNQYSQDVGKCAIYDSSFNLVSNSQTPEVTISDVSGAPYWYDFVYTGTKPKVTGGQQYYLCFWGNFWGGFQVRRSDSGSAGQFKQKLVNYGATFPASLSEWTVEAAFAGSIYGTLVGGAIPVTGNAGITVTAEFGASGAIGNPLAGPTGITVQAEFGTGGSIYTAIAGTAGMEVQAQFGTGGKLVSGISGHGGIDVRVQLGTTGAIFAATGRACTILVNGIDRSAWVEVGIRRQMQMGAGSRTACQFRVNNHRRAAWRPQADDEVLIYEGTRRFFAGIVESTSEFDFSGKSALHQIDVSCIDHGCLLDNIIVRAHYEEVIENAVLGTRFIDRGMQTETFVATGLWPQDAGFITRYAITGGPPTVTVNGSPVSVCMYGAQPPGFEGFDYIPDGWGVFTWPQAWQGYPSADRSGDPLYGSPYPDTDLPLWLNEGDVIEVTYHGAELVYLEQQSRAATADQIIADLVARYLSSYGIIYGGGAPAVLIGAQTFNYVSFTDALNSIAAKLGLEWRIDLYKTLWLFAPGSGYGPAPFTIATNDGNWAEMHVTRSRAQKRNRIYVRNSVDLHPLWTDTFLGDGERMVFPVYARLASAPQITVDTGSGDVGQTVVEFDAQSGNWQWTYKDFSVWAATPPPKGAVIKVTFPSPFSHVAVAEDIEDIARRGAIEAVEEVRDVQDLTSLQAIADGWLTKRNVEPVTVSLRTDKPGLEPGQLLSINTERPLVNATVTVQSVESEEAGKGKFFRHQVKASNAPQIVADDAAFYQRLLERTKQAKNTGTYTFIWHLAETIEGLDSPGLTTGYKTPSLVAPRAGVLRDCTLRFNSVEDGGTPTAQTISIDIEKNGVTVFGATKMEFPAGATGTKIQFVFASSPVTVAQGDVFRINVLAADALAKDGALALTVVG